MSHHPTDNTYPHNTSNPPVSYHANNPPPPYRTSYPTNHAPSSYHPRNPPSAPNANYSPHSQRSPYSQAPYSTNPGYHVQTQPPSQLQRSGCVQRLNNYFQEHGLTPSQYIVYSQPIPLPRDMYTVSVTLRNYNPYARYDGSGLGKHAAKEEAAYKALVALGVYYE